MEWKDYVHELLMQERMFEDIKISIDDGLSESAISPIIRASISMLALMREHHMGLNLLVFPERSQTFFILTLMKLLYTIYKERISINYNPADFAMGEKLQVGNAIAEFRGTENIEGELFLCLRLAESIIYKVPISKLPVFQKISTNRRLSKIGSFKEAVKDTLHNIASKSAPIAHAAQMRTHLDKSIYSMTSVIMANKALSNFRINGNKISDVFYVGKADYQGKISNMTAGQMKGIPSVIFASDLYAISAAIKNRNPAQSIIIDGSNSSILLNQLDALDELIRCAVPIFIIIDTVNSLDLDFLEQYTNKGFKVWRWEPRYLTQQLYDAVSLSSDKRINNCANQTIEYLEVANKLISTSIHCLASYRSEAKSYTSNMLKLYEKLNNLAFTVLRTTMPMNSFEIELASSSLDECSNILHEESRFLSDVIVSEYRTVIDALKHVYTDNIYLKEQKLKEYLTHLDPVLNSIVYLIIPENCNKLSNQNYWQSWCEDNNLPLRLNVMYPVEYYACADADANLTIICGWLKRAIMRKIIYSYKTRQYLVLLYECEELWKDYALRRWEKGLSISSNNEIVKLFSNNDIVLPSVRFHNLRAVNTTEVDNLSDELGEIECVLRENKYRKYGRNGNDCVQARPVNFMGGYIAFYRTAHKVVSATKVIMGESTEIETVTPQDLSVGDFVVEREAERDLIREIADAILKDEDRMELRVKAAMWREALKIELLFYTDNKLCEKFHEFGCNRNDATIKRWFYDDDIIAPSSKDDLMTIARVTQNETLQEKIDQIFYAAQVVRNAHKMAGKKLSELLQFTIANELQKSADIDPYNMWAPIDMEIEGIGNVKILKIIDIGAEVSVDASNTNRLIKD